MWGRVPDPSRTACHTASKGCLRHKLRIVVTGLPAANSEKNLPTSQYHLERCLPQSTSLTLGSPLQACIRCGNIVPLTPLHQPVTTAASLRVGPLWEHCKQNGCTIFLCSGNISISFNTTIKLHFVQIELKSSPARQHMSHVWTTHVPRANWAHLVAGYVELTKQKIKNKKLQIF